MKTKNKYGAIRVINRWFDLIPQIFKQWRIFINYAAAFTILSAVLNRWTYSCHGKLTGYWCHWYAGNTAVLIGAAVVFYILALYLLFSFSDDFYKGLLQNSVFKIKDVFSITPQRLKSIAVPFMFWGVIICSAALFAYILNKPANPDWRVEFVWFLIIFACFVITLLTLRCFGGMAYYFNERHISFRKIYRLTENRAYVGIFSFLALVIVCSSFNLSSMRYFDKFVENHNYLVTAVFTDFLDCVVKLFYFSLFLVLSQAEYIQMKEREKDEMTVTPAMVPPVEDAITDTSVETAAEKNISKKSAKKKKTQRKAKAQTETKQRRNSDENI